MKSVDLYKNNPVLQRWLEENWRTGSQCMSTLMKQQQHDVKPKMSKHNSENQTPSGNKREEGSSVIITKLKQTLKEMKQVQEQSHLHLTSNLNS